MDVHRAADDLLSDLVSRVDLMHCDRSFIMKALDGGSLYAKGWRPGVDTGLMPLYRDLCGSIMNGRW